MEMSMLQHESKQSHLGTGLSVLLNNMHPAMEEELLRVSVHVLRPGKYQPRQIFNKEELQELSDSLKQQGVLQPILVRPVDENPILYEIIAGERRWQAAKLAGLSEVPIFVRRITDKQALEMAIVENVQRKDLNLIEEALAYKRLIDEFNYTHEAVAESVKKSRSYITNTLRLLNLPEKVQDAVCKNLISASHARTLINMENAEELAEKIEKNQINVRQTEGLKRRKKADANPEEPEKNEDLQGIEEQLSKTLEMPVTIQFSKGSGTLTIRFKTLNHLDYLVEKLNYFEKY